MILNKNIMKVSKDSGNKTSITEAPSFHDNLESMSILELLEKINQEDAKVHLVVKQAIPQIQQLVELIVAKMKKGGRLFYIGAGTSGRLGVLDASEVPPTFGVPDNLVIGIIAGGDGALRKAVELAEDNLDQAWEDLKKFNIDTNDTLIGIAASGTTPYVIGGLKTAREKGILTGCITCNPNSKIAEAAEYSIEAIVGPEFVTGSTRLKAGTAQKLILNMITTSTMIKLGRVKGNKMVNMQLTNKKLIERGTQMIVDELQINREEAKRLLLLHRSVKKVFENYKS